MLRTESWSKIWGKKIFFYFIYSDRLTQDDKDYVQKSVFKKHHWIRSLSVPSNSGMILCSSKGISLDPKVIFPCYFIHNPLPFLRITPGSRTLAACIGLQGCLFPPVTRCRVEYSFDVEMPQTFIL